MEREQDTMSPKVTVYVPVWNTEKYVKACLDSILGQSYEDMEIIISDDGSTDGSLDICREYMSKDSRILLLERGEPHGSCGDINYALEKATGEFACKMDSDDIMGDRYWETVLPLFSRPRIGWVSIGFVNMSESGIPSIRVAAPVLVRNPLDIFMVNKFVAASPFRMEMFRQVGGWDIGHYHPDWDFWIRCILAKWDWTYCLQGAYYYRHRGTSMLKSDPNDVKKLEAREYYKNKFKIELAKIGWKPSPIGDSAIGIPKSGILPTFAHKGTDSDFAISTTTSSSMGN